MTQRRIRTALMDATVTVVARDGLDKLTTRSIASECDLHDAYIYRYFIDKEDLLSRTFIREDDIINELMISSSNSLDLEDAGFKERLIALWMPAWRYLIDNPDSCKFYVRYYYSVHFEKDTLEEFNRNNGVLKNTFKSILPEDISVEILFQHNIDTLLHLAMRIATGETEYTEGLDDEIFDLMYSINKAFVETRQAK